MSLTTIPLPRHLIFFSPYKSSQPLNSGHSDCAVSLSSEPQETQVWPLGWEDPLEKGMATHSSLLAWRIPRTEEHGGLQSIVSQSDATKATQHASSNSGFPYLAPVITAFKIISSVPRSEACPDDANWLPILHSNLQKLLLATLMASSHLKFSYVQKCGLNLLQTLISHTLSISVSGGHYKISMIHWQLLTYVAKLTPIVFPIIPVNQGQKPSSLFFFFFLIPLIPILKRLPYFRDRGSLPGLGRTPGEGHGNPVQYSCMENPMERGARHSPWCRKESNIAEAT